MAEHFTHAWDAQQFDVLVKLLSNSQGSSHVLDLLQAIKLQGDKIMATLDEVLTDVADESTKIDGLIALLAGIKKQLDDILAGQLPPEVQAKVDAVFAAVESDKAKVQSAIDTNTK